MFTQRLLLLLFSRCLCSPSHADALTTAWKSSLPSAVRLLPSLLPSPTPSPSHPFLFFHLRKAGGTTLRNAFHAAARRLQVESFIPCLTVGCEHYAPPLARGEAKRYAILAGHLHKAGVRRWLHQSRSGGGGGGRGVWGVGATEGGGEGKGSRGRKGKVENELEGKRYGEGEAGGREELEETRRLGCVVMLRQPVARVASCWNFRFVQEAASFGLLEGRGAPPIHLVSPSALNASLPIRRSAFSEGCNNEPLRVLSAVGVDEDVLSQLTTGERWSPYALPALHDALAQLSQCVVLVLERCEQTMAVLRHFIPWIIPHYDCSKDKAQVGPIG